MSYVRSIHPGLGTPNSIYFLSFFFFKQMLEAVMMGLNLLRHYLRMSGWTKWRWQRRIELLRLRWHVKGNSKEKNTMIACCLRNLHNCTDWQTWLTYGVGWKHFNNIEDLDVVVFFAWWSIGNAVIGDMLSRFCTGKSQAFKEFHLREKEHVRLWSFRTCTASSYCWFRLPRFYPQASFSVIKFWLTSVSHSLR